MYSPSRVDFLVGVLCMIPGVITAVLIEEIPRRVLIDPSIIPLGIIGAIWNRELLPLGLSLLYLLYFAGAVVLFVSLVNRVRGRYPLKRRGMILAIQELS